MAAGTSRSRTWLLGLWLAALVAGWVGNAAAAPVIYTVDPDESVGVDIAVGCTTTSCTTELFSQVAVADEVLGTITIDTAALTLSFALSSAVELSGSFNGVTSLDFDPIQYVSNGDLTLVQNSPVIYTIDGTLLPTASLIGTLNEGGVPVAPLSEPSVRVTGQCSVLTGSVLCGFTFGTVGFQVGVGDPDQNASFRHTMNVTAVPEPGSALLVGIAIAGLAFARRGRVW